MYATHENPFTYNSDPILFESFGLAEDYAKRFNSSTVVLMHLPVNSVAKVIKGNSNGDE
jgi:hypothetical protein